MKVKQLARYALGFVALAASMVAQAQSTTYDPRFRNFMDLTTGNKHTLTFGSNGTPLPTTPLPGSATTGGMGFAHTPGGWPTAGGTAQVPSPMTGKAGGAVARQAFTKGSTAAALAKFMKRAGPLATGMAIYDLMNELGLLCTFNASKNENECKQGTTGTQKEYNTGGGTFNLSTWSVSKESACIARDAWWEGLVTKPDGWSYSPHGYPFVAGQTWPNSTHCAIAEYNKTGAQQQIHLHVFVERDAVTYSNIVLTEEQVADKIAQQAGWPSTSAISRAAADAANAGGVFVPEGVPSVTVPTGTKVQADPTTTTSTDGASQTSQETCDLIALGNGSVEWRCGITTTTATPAKTSTETVVQTNPDGTTTTFTVTKTTPGGTVTTTTTGTDPNKQEGQKCGLAGQPACKVEVDETGVPTQAEVEQKLPAEQKAKDVNKDLEDFVKDPVGKAPAHPVINWAFVLPTGCAVIPTPAFAPFMTSMDVCQFQPVFHDIMGVVWVLGGLFGAISLFMRNTLSH